MEKCENAHEIYVHTVLFGTTNVCEKSESDGNKILIAVETRFNQQWTRPVKMRLILLDVKVNTVLVSEQ